MATLRRAIHRPRQLALTRPRRRVREAQRREEGVAPKPLIGLLVGPGQVALAVRREVRAELHGGAVLDKHSFCGVHQLEVDQRQLDAPQPRLAA